MSATIFFVMVLQHLTLATIEQLINEDIPDLSHPNDEDIQTLVLDGAGLSSRSLDDDADLEIPPLL